MAIHNTNELETIFGSDLLRLTPPAVLAHLYCMGKTQVKQTFAPIKETVIIGPPSSCLTEGRTALQKEGEQTDPNLLASKQIKQEKGQLINQYENASYQYPQLAKEQYFIAPYEVPWQWYPPEMYQVPICPRCMEYW